jgi:hypothetical protein
MKWLKRWFANKCREAWEESRNMPDEPMAMTKSNRLVRARDDFEAEEGLNMQVHKAIGGRIVSFNHYDRKTDRSYRKVYVIQDELDFERELGKIITMESMRG